MKNLSLSFFCITLLVGCSSNNVAKQNNVDANSDYFSDSSECSKVTLSNNQRMNRQIIIESEARLNQAG
jgi:uncharacterized protein YcfL